MLKDKLRKLLTGITIEKEYPCVDYAGLLGDVTVLMDHGDGPVDITHDHLFLGYKPLIAGIFTDSDIVAPVISISFHHQNKGCLARLKLRKFTSRKLGSHHLVLFTGVRAAVFFLPVHNRLFNRISRMLRKKKPGNVEMIGNEYLQVQAMYTVPRKISVISTGGAGLYNLFPTDLHGNAGKDYYVDSLRKAGKACAQVLQYRRVAKSDMQLSTAPEVFRMGKNHMQEPAPLAGFNTDGFSAIYQLPLPEGAVSYKEMELYDEIEIGIHRVLIFKTTNEEMIDQSAPVLSCVNSHYLQWRIDHSLPSNYV